MNKIRIQNLIDYYRSSLSALIDECYGIKEQYCENSLSYNKAWRALNQRMKLAWQRLKLCKELGRLLGYTPNKLPEYEQDLVFLTVWVNN